MFELHMSACASLIVAWRWWTKWSRRLLLMAMVCQWHSSACWRSSEVSRVLYSLLPTSQHHQHPMCLYLSQRLRASVCQIKVSLLSFLLLKPFLWYLSHFMHDVIISWLMFVIKIEKLLNIIIQIYVPQMKAHRTDRQRERKNKYSARATCIMNSQ